MVVCDHIGDDGLLIRILNVHIYKYNNQHITDLQTNSYAYLRRIFLLQCRIQDTDFYDAMVNISLTSTRAADNGMSTINVTMKTVRKCSISSFRITTYSNSTTPLVRRVI